MLRSHCFLVYCLESHMLRFLSLLMSPDLMRIPSWQEPCLILTPAVGPVLDTWEMLNMCLLDRNCWLKVYIRFLKGEFQASGFWMDYPAIPRTTPRMTCLVARTLISYSFSQSCFSHMRKLLYIIETLCWIFVSCFYENKGRFQFASGILNANVFKPIAKYKLSMHPNKAHVQDMG